MRPVLEGASPDWFCLVTCKELKKEADTEKEGFSRPLTQLVSLAAFPLSHAKFKWHGTFTSLPLAKQMTRNSLSVKKCCRKTSNNSKTCMAQTSGESPGKQTGFHRAHLP